MALENGIAQLIKVFVVARHPPSREQNIDDRGAGYIVSTALVRDTKARVQVGGIEFGAMMFHAVPPRGNTKSLPCVIYYHGGCFVSGGSVTRDNQLR